MKWFRFIYFLLLLSCARPQYVSDESIEQRFFTFLKDTKLTREDIIFRYGEPTWIFENGRIYTYRLVINDKEVMPKVIGPVRENQPVSYFPADAMQQFSLVLVFSGDRLEKYHLIRIVP